MDLATWEKQEVIRLLKGAPGTQYQQADDANKAIIRDWIKNLLQTSTITVTFVKADGTDREMLCTLNRDNIPTPILSSPILSSSAIAIAVTESRARKQPDEHSLRVFDMEKQEWRSFRFDRLKKITAELKFE